MKKHEISYHEHDDFISFHSDHCSHLDVSERSFSNQSQTKKKVSFSEKNFSDQSEIIEDKEIKSFLEKTNNLKMILKRTTSIEFNKRLNERSKKLIERRRINES
jgi:hypothetical protein